MSDKTVSSFGSPTLFAFAALASAMLLTGCNSSTAQVDEQVAIAKQAADRAIEAQKAAERAAKLARAQSGTATFGEDEIFEEVDDSSSEDVYDTSDSSDGTMGDDAASAGPAPR